MENWNHVSRSLVGLEQEDEEATSNLIMLMSGVRFFRIGVRFSRGLMLAIFNPLRMTCRHAPPGLQQVEACTSNVLSSIVFVPEPDGLFIHCKKNGSMKKEIEMKNMRQEEPLATFEMDMDEPMQQNLNMVVLTAPEISAILIPWLRACE
ncbi:hypothetical protein EJB05_45719 [Eragrostis curvula]|uniref:Uncharacterized protein n=1 Tax=Eragrostis curvula TaxID=38414 RepID=A0A5J9TLB5_9POAL|nr:hypothetical protein EJB05_45719 [Eragrostis curvula]